MGLILLALWGAGSLSNPDFGLLGFFCVFGAAMGALGVVAAYAGYRGEYPWLAAVNVLVTGAFMGAAIIYLLLQAWSFLVHRQLLDELAQSLLFAGGVAGAVFNAWRRFGRGRS